jgi:hypothetical protein
MPNGTVQAIGRLVTKCVEDASSLSCRRLRHFKLRASSLYAEGVVVNSRSVEERSDDTTGERRGQLATPKESSWA